MRGTARKIFGDKIADLLTDVWGFDEEGELRTMLVYFRQFMIGTLLELATDSFTGGDEAVTQASGSLEVSKWISVWP